MKRTEHPFLCFLGCMVVVIAVAVFLKYDKSKRELTPAQVKATEEKAKEGYNTLKGWFNNGMMWISDFLTERIEGQPISEEEYEEIANGVNTGTEKTVEFFNDEVLERAKEYLKDYKEGLNKGDVSLLEEVSLVSVVDGDTIWVTDEQGLAYKVRLIGIDTPESVHPNSDKNTEYGKLASDYTKELLRDVTTLYLQYDVEKTDKYDRTLAYVWLSDDVNTDSRKDIEDYMLNAIIVKNGYAINKEFAPNILYAKTFSDLRSEAESEEKGLWDVGW